MRRGILEQSETANQLDEILEYLPQAELEMIEEAGDSSLRYRERLKKAKDKGWVPKRDLTQSIVSSQMCESLWDFNTTPNRGFSAVSWLKRTKRMKELSRDLPSPTIKDIPDSPTWKPGQFVMIDGFSIMEYDDKDAEGGTRRALEPLVGAMCAPQLFLHYDNDRLILNAGSRKRF